MFNFFFKSSRNIRVFSKKRSQSDDPFVFLKNVFLDGGYNIITKNINFICIVLHTSSYLLEMNYLIHHFTLDFLLKYVCGIIVTTYVSTSVYLK